FVRPSCAAPLLPHSFPTRRSSDLPADTQLMSGADILVKSLVDHGVEVLFAYPGGASMPLHQSLTKYADRLRTILPRHEQGGAFRSEEHTSELQSRVDLVCRLLLEK